jgi:predicted RNA-binding Zn-ribbon protein involved in translation (DUF1610 family)
MRTDFICPGCANILNVGENVVFSTKSMWGKEGLILLHPELGNYTLVKHPAFEVSKGELLDFYCPYCGKKLQSDRHENLVMVLIHDDSGNEGEVHFSRVSGQHSTYKIVGQNMEIFGEDASDYYNFISKTKF